MAAKKQNTVRINAGEWRSRVIKFPDGDGLRPTPDRVRQTVFNWLGQDLTGQHCLDLFAGTGVMGFEALSRNAQTLTMVEYARPVFKALVHNKGLLKAEQCEIFNQDALAFLVGNTQAFDVIFCDPPYNKAWLDKLMPLLTKHLSNTGILYVEAEYEVKTDSDWHVIKQGKAGSVYYHLLQPVEK